MDRASTECHDLYQKARIKRRQKMKKTAEEVKVELYTNSAWTQRRDNVYVAEAVAWSKNGNHATIYTTGASADEAETKLTGALRELELAPQAPKRRMVRGNMPPTPHSTRHNREQGGETPRTDLKRLEQVVDQILADAVASSQDKKSTSCVP